MSKKDKNILRYNHGEKSLKVAHVIYADTESLLIKHQSSHQSYTEKKSTHEACGYSVGMVTSYDRSKSIHKYYRGKDCTKKFCNDLEENAIGIINTEKKILYH